MRNPTLQKVSLRLLKKTSKLPLLSGSYIAQFYDSVRRVLKLSWQFVVKYIWSFLIMTVVDIVMWVIVIKGFTVFIVFLPEISGFVHAYLLNRMFTKEIKN